MKKIERPNWTKFFLSVSGHMGVRYSDIDQWFDQYVEPVNKLIDEAVEVYGNDEHIWWYEGVAGNSAASKAYLIDIQPIQKETAEDVLRDIVSELDITCIPRMEPFYNRAKRILDES